MNYFIGIDSSHSEHVICILNAEGIIVKEFQIENNINGFNLFSKIISKYNNIYIGLEISRGHIIDFLHNSGHKIYSLNSLKIKRFKEAFSVSGDKSDKKDAWAISYYLLKNYTMLTPNIHSSSGIERLKLLTLTHKRILREQTRLKNRLIFLFKHYFPLYITLFKDPWSKIQLKMLLTFPTCKDLKSVDTNEIVHFLKNLKYQNPKYLERIIKKITQYSQCISEDIEYVYKMEATSIARMLLMLYDQLQAVEKEMTVIFHNHELGKCFQSLPGAGNILAPELLAYFGDNKEKFKSYNNVQCLFGTAPKNYQSGKYHKVIMRKICNKTARSILYQFAFSSIRFSKWAKEYYYLQRNKGKKHTVAVRALSNKWVKVIYKIWKDELVYDESLKFSNAA